MKAWLTQCVFNIDSELGALSPFMDFDIQILSQYSFSIIYGSWILLFTFNFFFFFFFARLNLLFENH